MKLLSRLAWLSFGAMLAIYGVMVGVTLPRIAAEAGGLLPFDLRPLGYSHEEAVDFVRALSATGRDIYLTIQHRLDIAYPALLSLTLALAIVLTAPRGWGWMRWLVAIVVAVPSAVFDYLENAAVGQMLNTSPSLIRPEVVETVSLWTVLKSATGAAAMVFVLLMLIGWLYRRIAGRGF
ncbi:MAG: hypothetical protein KF723_10780 [Rhizobiaceae bacterium]|nr:hypothetical protein [Rhizobiaceae bacterium]